MQAVIENQYTYNNASLTVQSLELERKCDQCIVILFGHISLTMIGAQPQPYREYVTTCIISL